MMTHALKALAALLILLQSASAGAMEAISLHSSLDMPLGRQIVYFQESPEQSLSLEQAIARFKRGDYSTARGDSISLGLGVSPVWMNFVVEQSGPSDLPFRLSIDTPWLDYIDAYLVSDLGTVRHVKGGDGLPFEQRPMPYKAFAFEHDFVPGTTQVFVRVESVGPMALPVRLSSQIMAERRDLADAYQYGALYGFMGALALYNLVLFAFIRQREYGLYGIYLLGFILNSLSYTGQIHTVITPDFGPYFQDWTDIFLMITYSVAGLHFARYLLDTGRYAPRLDTFVKGLTIAIPAGMLLGVLVDSLFLALVLAFLLNSSFAILFVVMGVLALRAGIRSAQLFLVSSVTAATCIGISTMAVGGLMPYNDLTFKLIEIGMSFEALFLAVILAKRFRVAQQDRMVAERFARTDPLTGLNNRRGFEEIGYGLWCETLQKQQDLALILLDIDYFKQVNDSYGHDVGDKVLCEVAKALQQQLRSEDVLARWGGEEFIILLPNTCVDAARTKAELIRSSLCIRVFEQSQDGESITASLGVVGTRMGHYRHQPLVELELKKLIKDADLALYKAKEEGRNRVICPETCSH